MDFDATKTFTAETQRKNAELTQREFGIFSAFSLCMFFLRVSAVKVLCLAQVLKIQGKK